MGGKIDVVDAPGRGCTFAFTAVFESVHRKTEPMASPVGSRLSTEKKNRREAEYEAVIGTNYPTLLRAQSAGIGVHPGTGCIGIRSARVGAFSPDPED